MDLRSPCAEPERQNDELESRNINLEKQLKEFKEKNSQLESANRSVILENKYLKILLREVRESKDLLKLNTELLVLEIQTLKTIEEDDQRTVKQDNKHDADVQEVDESTIFHSNERKYHQHDANVESNDSTHSTSVIRNGENSNHTVDKNAKRFNRGVWPLKNKNDYSLDKSSKLPNSKKYVSGSMKKHMNLKRKNIGKRTKNINTITPSRNGIKETLGLKGLKNIGNTCFMNSVIQCLSNTRWLLEYLMSDAYFNDLNTNISNMNGLLIKSFAEVIKELWSVDSSGRVVKTFSFKSHIGRIAPDFDSNDEQDAYEFLRYLLDGLHEDINRMSIESEKILTEIDGNSSDSEKSQESWSRYLRMNNSRIADYFAGQLKSTLTCSFCCHRSVTFDPFWGLSLPIPQGTDTLNLTQCLDVFTKEETLDDLLCSRCGGKRKFTKSLSIDKLPKILMIHLMRFSQEGSFLEKLRITIDFPLEGLDMSEYTADNATSCLYNLYAMCNHHGTLSSGHYTAFCRHPYAGIWHEYNDSRVSPVSLKSLVSEEAYVLFYELDGTG